VPVRSLCVPAARHRALRLLALGGLVIGGWLLGALSGTAHAETGPHPVDGASLSPPPGMVAVQEQPAPVPSRTPIGLRIPERLLERLTGPPAGPDTGSSTGPDADPDPVGPDDPGDAAPPAAETARPVPSESASASEPRPSAAPPRVGPPAPSRLAVSTPGPAAGGTPGEVSGAVRDDDRETRRPVSFTGAAEPRLKRPAPPPAQTDAPSPRPRAEAFVLASAPSVGAPGDVLGGDLHRTPGPHVLRAVPWPSSGADAPPAQTDVDEPPMAPD